MRIVAEIVLAALFTAPAYADGNAAAGEKVFAACAACHSIGDGATAKIGPPLNNIVGAVAGAQDFSYSDAMRTARGNGLVWTPATLAQFLSGRAGDFLPRTKMTFAGLRSQQKVDDVIAYLEGLFAGWQHVAAPPPPPSP